MSSFSDCSLPTISSAGPPKSAYMLNTYIFFAFLFCYVLSQVFVYVCSNVWIWCVGYSQFFYLKLQILVFVVVLAPLPQAFVFNFRLKAFVFALRSKAFVFGPRYLNFGSHLTLQSLVPLVHLDVVQLELLLITDHLQRNSIIIKGDGWSISIDITQHCKKIRKHWMEVFLNIYLLLLVQPIGLFHLKVLSEPGICIFKWICKFCKVC